MPTGFQLTAARRRLEHTHIERKAIGLFQLTAARRRLALFHMLVIPLQCFNSQPPEGGWDDYMIWASLKLVSTHSRPKAAGFQGFATANLLGWFQLTAARRRLATLAEKPESKPRFNSQPPEGGWWA